VIIKIDLKYLLKIEDMYKDGTTFHRSLQKGEGSASPRTDYTIRSKYTSYNLKLKSNSK
jgi:hypothetical protein